MRDYILNLATKRKTTRKFRKDEIHLSQVIRVLDVARQAPSGANKQPWRFIVVTDPKVKRRLKQASEKGEREFYEKVNGKLREWLINQNISPEKQFLEEAPILIVVLKDVDAPYAKESVWVAIGFILLALEEIGLSTVTYTPSNTEYPLKELGAPPGFKLEAVLPLGYSADDKPKLDRKKQSEITHLNHWGRKIGEYDALY